MAPPLVPSVPIRERFTDEELAAVEGLPVEELRRRWHALSDSTQAITKGNPTGWWKDEAVAASVFKALRYCELYRTLCAGRTRDTSEVTVVFTRDENEHGYSQDCVIAYCLAEEANDPNEPNEGVRVWGHTDRSVKRALHTLTTECLCGAAKHVRR